METVERLGLGIPVVLLGAVWGAFGLVLKVFELLNASRNSILKLRNVPDFRNNEGLDWHTLFYNDWLPLWLGTCLFLATITGIILFIPQFFEGSEIDNRTRRRVCRICYSVAILPGFSFLGFAAGGALDIVMLF